MRPFEMLALRLFTLTLGRWPVSSRVLRRVLVALLIRRRTVPYNASSRFFDPGEIVPPTTG